MMDLSPKFKGFLEETGVETVYELFIDKCEAIPLISYMEISNTDSAFTRQTDKFVAFSKVAFQVKIFAKTISEVQSIFGNLDKILKREGYKRTSAMETTDEDLIVKILRYEIKCYENKKF